MTQPSPGSPRPAAYPTFAEATRVWARVAALSFGGPAGQIAVMHRILVEEKRWIGERRFLHALNYCMLLPGPEAQQLATYVGWLLHGTRGGLVAGGLFILPGAIAIMGLSLVYAAFGQVPLVTALFFGLKAAVLAVVLQAVARLSARALRSRWHHAIAAAAFVAIFVFGVPFPVIVIAAGLAGWFVPDGEPARGTGGGSATPPAEDGVVLSDEAARVTQATTRGVALACLLAWLVPVAALLLTLGPNHPFSLIALFFSKMAMVTFGGAYAALAYVAQQAVDGFHWLRPGEMLDGLGMAETTPGPLIMVLQFVGFMAAFRDPGDLPPLLAGALGGLVATWVTFAPCFLWIFAGAPHVETLRGNRSLAAALSGITAAVVGVILNLALWFAIHTLFHETRRFEGPGFRLDLPLPSSADAWAFVLAGGALLAVFRLRAGMGVTLAACAAAGVALHLLGLHG